jgi:hypothetical protein
MIFFLDELITGSGHRSIRRIGKAGQAASSGSSSSSSTTKSYSKS